MPSLDSELRRVRKLAEEHALDDEASTALPETAAWWRSLGRRRQIEGLRNAPNRRHFACPSLSGAECPHDVHALLCQAAERGQRDWLHADVGRVWSIAVNDREGDASSNTWEAFFSVIRDVAQGDPAHAESIMPPCPVCEPDLLPEDDQQATWVRNLPPDRWVLLQLLGQNLNWRAPHLPTIEQQWRWVTGLEEPPRSDLSAHEAARLYKADPTYASAWEASVRDLADVLATSPAYHSLINRRSA